MLTEQHLHLVPVVSLLLATVKTTRETHAEDHSGPDRHIHDFPGTNKHRHERATRGFQMLTVLALFDREVFDRNCRVFVHAQRYDFLLQAARLPHHERLHARGTRSQGMDFVTDEQLCLSLSF